MVFSQLCLFLFVELEAFRQKKDYLIFPIITMWVFMAPATTMLSMQFSSVINITMISLWEILHNDERLKNQYGHWALFFMIIGCLVSYFDLLTFPIVALRVPLAMWITLNDNGRLLQNLKK